jgi:hypothetical protein
LAKGWITGIAGTPEESEEILGNFNSWDLETANDSVTGSLRLLKGTRCVVTLDSGIGHLASLVDAPQLVIYNRPGDENAELVVRDDVKVKMQFQAMLDWNQNLCRPISGGVPDVIAAIETVLAGKGAELPVSLGPSTQIPILADGATSTARLRVCQRCDSWSVDHCTVAGCACTGTGFAARALSRCPRGLWPA